MKYRFKALPELYWSLITSGATVLLLALVSFDPATITDWKTWAVGLGSGVLRSMAGAALDWLRRQMTDTPEPTLADQIVGMRKEDRIALILELQRRHFEMEDMQVPPPPPPPAADRDPFRPLPGG